MNCSRVLYVKKYVKHTQPGTRELICLVDAKPNADLARRCNARETDSGKGRLNRRVGDDMHGLLLYIR